MATEIPKDVIPSWESIRQEMERWVNVAKTTGERAVERFSGTASSLLLTPADVIEEGDQLVVSIDLPGVTVEGVDVTLLGTQLTIRGRRTLRVPSTSGRFHLHERVETFERVIHLPCPVEPNQVNGVVANGVLDVTLQKVMLAESRTIPVTQGHVG